MSSPATPASQRPGLRTVVATAAAVSLSAGLAVAAAPAASATPVAPTKAAAKSDMREINSQHSYATKKLSLRAGANRRAATAVASPPVGTQRTLIALDDF